MRIPKTFQLGGFTWKVEQVSGSQDSNPTDWVGRTIQGSLTIQIRKEMPQELKEQTFFHELLHACFFAQGKTSDLHDEREIDSLATLLHQAMKTAK
jgi:hypothetical protein